MKPRFIVPKQEATKVLEDARRDTLKVADFCDKNLWRVVENTIAARICDHLKLAGEELTALYRESKKTEQTADKSPG